MLTCRSHGGRSLLSNKIDRAQIAKAYQALLDLGAGLKFQETAAAKTMHALRPESLSIWDAAIKEWFIDVHRPSARGSGSIYAEFLNHVAGEISELNLDMARLGHSLTDIPQLVDHAGGSLVKLVDEHYWVTITDGHAVPSRSDLERWLRWA